MANKLWQRWKRLAHRAAEIQAILVLTVVYWIIVAPIGAVLKARSRRKAEAGWTVRPPTGAVAIEDARRQS